MRVFIALTYYRPHISGLTVYTERIANALVELGHEVTVLTSRFDRHLPPDETMNGVHVVRAPVWFKISKGVIMPTIGFLAWKLVMRADVLLLHLPQFDAAGIAARGRLLSKPTILTYHCDLRLPLGIFHGTANFIVHRMNHIAARLSDSIVTNTQDYAGASDFLRRYRGKVHIIPPPVETAEYDSSDLERLSKQLTLGDDSPCIGMVSRFAAEKGIEVLLNAFPMILERYPRAKILFVGPYLDVIGERRYYEDLVPVIGQYQRSGRWLFAGMLQPEALSAFYRLIDVLVVPSLNSTESFGLVQIEAMMHGTPCVTSDLPGMRIPIRETGMGKLFAAGNPRSFTEALFAVLAGDFVTVPMDHLRKTYGPIKVATAYERHFVELLSRKSS